MTTVAAEHASIRTTHIGSLPRPPDLLEHVASKSTGERLDDPRVADLVRSAIEQVVRKQAEIGLDIANNGEQSRAGFHLHVTDRLRGFGELAPAPFWQDVEEYPAFADREFSYPETDPDTGAPLRPAVEGPIAYTGTANAEREIETFLAAVEAVDHDFADLFMTSPSPGIVAASLPDHHYGEYEAYVQAIADALATEWQLIADAGLVLQIDAPELLHTHHRSFPPAPASAPPEDEAYTDVVSMYVDAINSALPAVDRDRVRLHTCWGNYEGPHHRDVALADVLPELYELDVGGLSVELTGPRHGHEVAAFREHPVPDGLSILPGVVDVKSNVIDHPDTVAMRLERAVEAIGDPSRVIAAPSCGFGTLAWSGAVEEIAWAKLEALVEGARRANATWN